MRIRTRSMRSRLCAVAVLALLATAGTALSRTKEIITVYYDQNGQVMGEHRLLCDGSISSWGSRAPNYERHLRDCP